MHFCVLQTLIPNSDAAAVSIESMPVPHLEMTFKRIAFSSYPFAELIVAADHTVDSADDGQQLAFREAFFDRHRNNFNVCACKQFSILLDDRQEIRS